MRIRVAALFAVTLMVLCMAACDSPTTTRLPSPTPTPATPASPTAVATMPALIAEKGWHIVLTLGNKPTTTLTSGSFVATKPYRLFFTCKGLGTLRISYPQVTVTIPCTGIPELNGTDALPPPSGNHSVTVSAATEGTADWQAIVETQD